MTSPIQTTLDEIHARFAVVHDGAVARYIPELSKADPEAFGLVVATVDGQIYEVGDTRLPFTIQSVSKPLVYGVALEDAGRERVARCIGVEPSGDAFNSISLEPGSGRPLNPMINAGAIATAALVGGGSMAARLARVVDALSAYAGRPLQIDEAVYESERSSGHRNRAIGHMLRNYDILGEDPEPALDLYFKQCSILVDARDLALIAATLANGGVNPASGRRAVGAAYTASILSVMTTCGMYDFSGEWVYRVGMPAKSGVGGGIIAVLPGQLGIGVYSPRLDDRGNSVRGVKACDALSAELGLHFLQPPRPSVSTVRARYTLARLRSKRRRTEADNRRLDAEGHRVLVFELQGDLRFATLEPVLRQIDEAGRTLRYVVLDFKRVSNTDDAATRLLARLVGDFARQGRHLVLTRVRRTLLSDFSAEVEPHASRAASFQPHLDLGLEWCERGLLDGPAPPHALPAAVALAAMHACQGMPAADVAALQRRLEPCSFEPGACVMRRGDDADAVFFLTRGEVSVVVEPAPGEVKRLATLSAGACFGEAAVIVGGQRSADVRADTPVECLRLPVAAFLALETEEPQLMIRLLHNLLASTVETTRRLTAEIAALEG